MRTRGRYRFHFSSHASKALCKQLKENNRVEACFYAPGPGGRLGPMLRVCGETEFVVSLEYKKRLLEERPILKRIYGVEEADDPGPVIFRIFRGEARFWTMEYNLRQSSIMSCASKKEPIHRRGNKISNVTSYILDFCSIRSLTL